MAQGEGGLIFDVFLMYQEQRQTHTVDGSRSPSATHATLPPDARPVARGKFLFVGNEKFFVRGVTYGTFRPGKDGSQFPDPDVAERDLSRMVAHGLNTIRTYTVPPTWLLDAAFRH